MLCVEDCRRFQLLGLYRYVFRRTFTRINEIIITGFYFVRLGISVFHVSTNGSRVSVPSDDYPVPKKNPTTAIRF